WSASGLFRRRIFPATAATFRFDEADDERRRLFRRAMKRRIGKRGRVQRGGYKEKRRRSHRRPRRPREKREPREKTMEPFSLSRRGRLKNFRQVSWLGLILLAAPSHPSTSLGTVA